MNLKDFQSLHMSMPEWIKFIETKLIAEALYKNFGNITKASKVLGLTRTCLTMKMKRYKIKKEDYV